MQTSLRHGLRFLVLGLLALLPAVAQAGGALLVKGGTMRLADDTQTVDATQISLDEISRGAFAVNVEGRKRNGIALGGEYLTYRHDFSYPVSQSGEARTQMLQFLAKKYFIQDGPLHPYLGIGLGLGFTDVSSNSGVVSDLGLGFAMQVLLGLEVRFDNLSFLAEVKHLYYDIDGGGNDYNPTAIGVFAGMGFNW